MRILMSLVMCFFLFSCDQSKSKAVAQKPKVSKKVKTPDPEEIRQQRIREKISEIKAQISEIKSVYLNTRVSVKTLEGVEFENAEIMDWNPLKVHLYSKKGLELVGIKELSKEDGEKVGFDYKLASDYSKMQAYLKKQKSKNSQLSSSTTKKAYTNPFVKKFKSSLVMAN